MADLNALIAQGAQFRVPPPVDPMGNMPQLMQMQSMQQQNQLNQMTMQESQRGQQEMNALRGVMSRPGFDLSTPASQRDVYNVAPTLAENFIKGHFGNLKTAAEVKNLGFTGQEVQAKAAAERAKIIAQAGRDINSRPDDENIISHARDIQNSSLFTPEEKQAAADKTQRLLAMSMADRTEFLSQQGATAGELRPQVVAPGASLMRGSTVVGTAPKEAPTYAPSPDQQGYDVSKAQGYKGTFLEYKKELANAGRAPAQPRAESAPVAVVGGDGKIKYVSREEAITKGMTPASAQEGLPPKEIQKREAALPKSTAAIKMMEDSTDKLITQMQLLRNHPGLSGITGLIMGVTPALTSSARSAQAILDTIKAKGTLSVLTAVRNASATGGALGNTSNKDIDLLERGFGALKTTQSTNDFKTQIGNVISDLEATKLRAREAYDDTYAYKTTAPAATPIDPAIEALLKKYPTP